MQGWGWIPNLPNFFGNVLSGFHFGKGQGLFLVAVQLFLTHFDLNGVFVLCLMLPWQPSSGGMLTTVLKCIFLTKNFLFARSNIHVVLRNREIIGRLAFLHWHYSPTFLVSHLVRYNNINILIKQIIYNKKIQSRTCEDFLYLLVSKSLRVLGMSLVWVWNGNYLDLIYLYLQYNNYYSPFRMEWSLKKVLQELSWRRS